MGGNKTINLKKNLGWAAINSNLTIIKNNSFNGKLKL